MTPDTGEYLNALQPFLAVSCDPPTYDGGRPYRKVQAKYLPEVSNLSKRAQVSINWWNEEFLFEVEIEDELLPYVTVMSGMSRSPMLYESCNQAYTINKIWPWLKFPNPTLTYNALDLWIRIRNKNEKKLLFKRSKIEELVMTADSIRKGEEAKKDGEEIIESKQDALRHQRFKKEWLQPGTTMATYLSHHGKDGLVPNRSKLEVTCFRYLEASATLDAIDAKQIAPQLTPAQHEAIEEEAVRMTIAFNKSYMAVIPNTPDPATPRGYTVQDLIVQAADGKLNQGS